jgi:hypothetical protein
VPLGTEDQRAAAAPFPDAELLRAADKPPPIRIILADDQQLTRAGLRCFSNRKAMVGEAGDAARRSYRPASRRRGDNALSPK